MEQIGVRELRQHASRYLARVADGESLEVTDRGRPVAHLVPIEDDPWDVLERAGLVSVASGRDLLDLGPARLPDGSRLASDVLVDLRDDER